MKQKVLCIFCAERVAVLLQKGKPICRLCARGLVKLGKSLINERVK